MFLSLCSFLQHLLTSTNNLVTMVTTHNPPHQLGIVLRCQAINTMMGV